MRSSTHVLALSALALLSLGAAACGSDKADSSATTAAAVATTASTTASATASTTASTTAQTTAAIAADTTADTTAATTANSSADTTDSTSAGSTAEFDVVAYCEAEVAVEQGGADLGNPDADTKAVATAFLPLAQRVHDLAPPELTPLFDTALAAVKTVIETGTTEALESLDLNAAHEYDVANCGWTTTAVKTQDYKFVGLPESLTAGTYNFEVTNEGTEPHVLLIVKKKAGVTDSYDEILADPASAESKVDTVAAAFNPPGGNGHAVASLEPGEYLAVCPISKGTTMTTEGTGESHYMLGMKQVITVTA